MEDYQRLLVTTQVLASRIQAINEIATQINHTHDLEQILKVVGKQARWLLDFDHCSICVRQSTQAWQSRHLAGQPLTASNVRQDNNVIAAVLNSGHPQLRHHEDGGALHPFASQLVIPLISEDEILGTLNFAAAQPEKFTREDVRIGHLLAVQVAAALRSATRFAEINRLKAEVEREKRLADELLHNILPASIADELKQKGHVDPVHFESTTVMFTDFAGFTAVAAHLSPQALLDELNFCFSAFDQIIGRYNLEKLKTNGDSYMCMGGAPLPRDTHAFDVTLAALEIRNFMQARKTQKLQQHVPYWDVRIGIHSGPLVAGVIGNRKFAYDVWGDTVNVASRMESNGKPGAVNISHSTYQQIRRFFNCHHRGQRQVKGKGKMDMYTVSGMRSSPLPCTQTPTSPA